MDYKVYTRAIVLNDSGKLLMLQKNSNQIIAPGKWLMPGGAVEYGETAQEALKRELKEETGLIVQDLKLLAEDVRLIGETHWHGLIFQAHGDLSLISNLEPQKHAAIDWQDLAFARTVLSSNEWRAVQACRK